MTADKSKKRNLIDTSMFKRLQSRYSYRLPDDIYHFDDLSIVIVVHLLFVIRIELTRVCTIITKSPGLFSDEGHNSPTSVGTVIAMTLVSHTPLIYYY